MKDIKKNVTVKSKVKLRDNKETPFEIDLNYSEEYDSFNIKVKKDVGFMSYTDSLQGLPLEVVQKLNEMLEEILVKAGSEYEMKEHKMFDGGKVDSKLTENEVEKIAKETAKALGSKFSVTEGTIDNGSFDLDYDGVKYDGGSYIVLENGDVKNVALPEKPIAYNYKTKKKYEFGGDFQSGVYNRGGAMKNERLHVNKDEDYEVRYSKPRPHRKGYKGLRNFEGGGEMDLNDDKRLRLRKPVMPERKYSKKEWAEKYNPRAYEFMGKDKMATGGGVGEKVYFLKKSYNKYTPDYWEEATIVNLSENEIKKQWAYIDWTKEKVKDYVVIKIGGSNGFMRLIKEDELAKKMADGGGVGLIGNQKRIDMNKNGKIDAEDFKLLRSSMNGAWRNERKHVNHNEDYEVRYAKPRPKRTGYKGKRTFEGGGGISKFKMLSDKVAKNYEGKRVKPQYQKEYGKVYSKSEAKEVGDKVAGKVKANQKMASGGETKKGARGGIMTLAKKIRKDGESWQDAVKRAGQQLK